MAAGMQIAREPGQMPVQSRDTAAVCQNDGPAVATTYPLETDAAVAGRVHGRASGRCVIRAHVTAYGIEDGVPTMGVERGTHAREIHRGAQEGLAHGLPLRRVVADVTACVEANGAVQLAVVDELGSEQLAVARIFPILVNLFVDGSEAVSLANVEYEVDIPGEHGREFQGDGIGNIGRFGCLKQ